MHQEPSNVTVVWLVPSLIEGSGGHRTILAHAAALETAGCHCVILLEDAPAVANLADWVASAYDSCLTDVRVGWNNVPPGDVVVATSWRSAYYARRALAPHKLYFVQDWEASFNPAGAESAAAEETYRLGFRHITIGRWLTHRLRAEQQAWARHFDFGANPAVYFPVEREAAGDTVPTVCFLYQPDKPRRATALGIEALRWLQARRPDVRIVLYGSAIKPPRGLRVEHRGLLRRWDCAALYREATVGLSLSVTNPSRVPFEMMACGCPVVELHRDSSVWDLPGEAMLLAQATPGALGSALLKVIEDTELRARMSKAGAVYMESRTEDRETRQFVQRFAEALQHGPGAGALPALVREYPHGPVMDPGPATFPGEASRQSLIWRLARRVWRFVKPLVQEMA